jgi:hypothetical protein
MEINYSNNTEVSNILKNEIKAVIKKLGEEYGTKNLIAEIITPSGELGIELLQKLFNKIWNTKQWPGDWTRSTFINIHRKEKLTKYDKYRTISLISHAIIFLLYVINERLKTFLQSKISQEKAVFFRA